MANIDELLEALEKAARANHRDEFDRHEAKLLSHFGGFHGMPRDVYQRYVEVDHAWPASLSSAEDGSSHHVTRLPLHTRVPDELISWLQELGAETGRNRADVVTACLKAVQGDRSLRDAVVKALSDPPAEYGDD